MSARVLVVPALALACAPAARASDLDSAPPERYRLRVEYREFRPELTGQLEVGAEASIVDVEEDLGVRDERTFELRGTIQFAPGHKLRASYTSLDQRGEAVASRSFRVGGTRFDVATRVESGFDGAYYAAAYEWDLVRRPGGFFGLLVGGRLVDGEWSVAAPELDRRAGDELQLAIPVVGVAGRAYVGRLSLEAELAGLTLGDRGRLLEAEASVRLHLSDRLAVQGGYRLVDVRGREGEDTGDLRLGGWNFGLELSL